MGVLLGIWQNSVRRTWFLGGEVGVETAVKAGEKKCLFFTFLRPFSRNF
jgi:hypothetical protein